MTDQLTLVRIPRFSLRSLLLAMLCAAIGLAWFLPRAPRVTVSLQVLQQGSPQQPCRLGFTVHNQGSQPILLPSPIENAYVGQGRPLELWAVRQDVSIENSNGPGYRETVELAPGESASGMIWLTTSALGVGDGFVDLKTLGPLAVKLRCYVQTSASTNLARAERVESNEVIIRLPSD